MPHAAISISSDSDICHHRFILLHYLCYATKDTQTEECGVSCQATRPLVSGQLLKVHVVQCLRPAGRPNLENPAIFHLMMRNIQSLCSFTHLNRCCPRSNQHINTPNMQLILPCSGFQCTCYRSLRNTSPCV